MRRTFLNQRSTGKLAIGLFCLFVLGAGGCASLGGVAAGKRLVRIQRSPNYVRAEFKNMEQTTVMKPGSFWRIVGRWIGGSEQRTPASPPPVKILDASSFREPPASGLRVTWIGHATMLVEIDGFRVLTDPIFSARCTPVAGVGPRRFSPAPLKMSQLPSLTAVVISHDHYDHLDAPTVRTLAKTGVTFYVPLGVGAHLERWEVPRKQIVELDWWEQARAGGGKLILTATPARHFSGRRLFDRNKTQWATWVISGPRHRVFFGGDTGMFAGLSDIGRRYGPFDATLMPIGAYGEAWPLIHLDPEQAVLAHGMVHGKVLLPMHWGTFNLALHAWNEPPERLLRSARARGVTVAIPVPGQQVDLSDVPAVRPWWR